MSFTHQGLGSPVSPILSRQNSFGPLSQYHHSPPTSTEKHQKKSTRSTTASIVSPLSANFSPDSPTLGFLSPVSIVSPELSVPAELLHRDHHHRTPAAAVEVEEPQPVHHLAPRRGDGGTLYLQDHVPFKQQPARNTTKTTRFPPPQRKPVPASSAEAGPPSSSSERPVTMYLADHQPHRVAARPITPPPPVVTTTRAHDQNGGGVVRSHVREEEEGPTFQNMGALQEIELGELTATAMGGGEEAADIRERVEYAVKRRRRNCLVGWVSCLAVVVIIVVFAVLVIEVNKPSGVAG